MFVCISTLDIAHFRTPQKHCLSKFSNDPQLRKWGLTALLAINPSLQLSNPVAFRWIQCPVSKPDVLTCPCMPLVFIELHHLG